MIKCFGAALLIIFWFEAIETHNAQEQGVNGPVVRNNTYEFDPVTGV